MTLKEVCQYTRLSPSTIHRAILKGSLRADFYNEKRKYLFSKIINQKDIIMLVHGGHGFKILKDVEMLEIKQGPYNLIKDKVKFENVDEKKVKIKK